MHTAATRSALLDDLVDANHILFHQGIVDAFGHVSVRSGSDPCRFFMARNLAPGNVSAADILEYAVETGEAVRADPPRLYLERYIHCEIYQARPDVMAVVHNHSPAVLPFTIARGARLRAACHLCGFLGADGPPLFEIRDHAIYRAVYTEVNAKLLLQALPLGGVDTLTPGEAEATRVTNEGQAARPWNLWKQQARAARGV